jgi:hypothetical protein
MHRHPVNGHRLFRRADLENFLHGVERLVNACAKKRKPR